ncbi:MAG: arginine--tRNA ligase [Deltaproteobacteria bacterium]|nr:arginine--tRNA ligase [Deltaproteobacteria bacterium]
MKETLIEIIRNAIVEAQAEGEIKTRDLPPLYLEASKNAEHGDFAVNIAMKMAQTEGKPPRKIAETIIKKITGHPIIDKAEIAGPGFINFFMSNDYWLKTLSEIEALGESYGKCNIGKGQKVLLEYVSANPTGPLHIGHGRGAALGDSLSRLLRAAGYDVTTEFYVNDAGSQVQNLALSVLLRCREINGEKVEWTENLYKGEYINDLAQEFLKKGGNITVEEAGPYALNEILGWLKRDLSGFNITFDKWFSEKSLYTNGEVQKAIEELKGKGLIYGKDGALWFKSTDFGDDKDRVVIRENGEPTYFASDIAYHHDKYERGFDILIDIWGADHHGYIPRMKAVVQALGHDKESLRVLLVQMVSLLRSGQPVTMSKRAGEFVTLKEVMDEVGADSAKYTFMTRRPDSQMDFDLEVVKSQSSENPVFYLQYAYARACNIERFASERNLTVLTASEVNLGLLKLPEEIRIIKSLTAYPEVVEGAAISFEPHRLTVYLQELAGHFHSYYRENRVVTDDIPLSQARMVMVRGLKTVIGNALGLLGVSAPRSM